MHFASVKWQTKEFNTVLSCFSAYSSEIILSSKDKLLSVIFFLSLHLIIPDPCRVFSIINFTQFSIAMVGNHHKIRNKQKKHPTRIRIYEICLCWWCLALLAAERNIVFRYGCISSIQADRRWHTILPVDNIKLWLCSGRALNRMCCGVCQLSVVCRY